MVHIGLMRRSFVVLAGDHPGCTDEISVNIAGTFAADKFITLTNKTKNPVISSVAP